jgi:hypothetical protein
MHRDELMLVAFIAICSGVLIYSLGASVTGYVIQTTYCKEGWCNDYCRFDPDCSTGQVCCEMQNFGVCAPSAECAVKHDFQPQVDISTGQMKDILEKPASDYKKEITMVTTLLFALSIVVAFYYKRK